MRSLKQFITESVHTYNYTIKIAGQIDSKFLDLFKHNLKKFDPIEMSEPKSTPIQKDPYGFPGVENESVNIIKCKFRYPATEPMIQQMAQLLGYDVNKVRVVNTDYNDSINGEIQAYENQPSPLLATSEFEAQKGAKEAAKAYGDSYLSSIKEQTKDDKIDMPFAGKKTTSSFDPFKPFAADEKNKSPMSKMTRTEKPKTGATGK